MWNKESYDGYLLESEPLFAFREETLACVARDENGGGGPDEPVIRVRVYGPLSPRYADDELNETFRVGERWVVDPPDWNLEAPYPPGVYNEEVLYHGLVLNDVETVHECLRRGFGTERTLERVGFSNIGAVSPMLLLDVAIARRAAGVPIVALVYWPLLMDCRLFTEALFQELGLAGARGVLLEAVVAYGGDQDKECPTTFDTETLKAWMEDDD